MSLTYATWVATISNLTVIDAADPDFMQILPECIDDAEQRMYRDLDLLSTVTRQTGTLAVGTRTFNLPTTSGRFVVTNGFNVITPSSATNPDLGTRNPLTQVSRDVLDILWPSTTGATLPTLAAMITDQQIIVGPAPSEAFTIEVVGTIRPTPLSASNTSTYLTLYLPDLLVAASMAFMSGYMRNFGAQADNPQMAMSWETKYKTQLTSANVEEQRKRWASGAWSSMAPTPIATASR